MRRVAIEVAAILMLVSCAWAQDEPLGDVARKAREEHARAPRAATVLSNEGSAVTPVKPGDDPVEVVARARKALGNDTSHSCRQESSGNSGPAPGWTNVEIMEVSGRDRRHIVADELRPKASHGEWIIIGDDVYRMTGSGPWQKVAGPVAAMAASTAQVPLPDILAFGFHPGDLKPLGRDAIGATLVYGYQYSTHSDDFDRTTTFWIGADDSLPRKLEMRTVTRSWGTAPVWWTETTYCSYGAVTIKPPM